MLSLKSRFVKPIPFSLLFIPPGLSTAKRKFADSLNEFKFQCIGDAETDDEICIGEPDMNANQLCLLCCKQRADGAVSFLGSCDVEFMDYHLKRCCCFSFCQPVAQTLALFAAQIMSA